MLCAKLLPLEHCNSSIYQTFAQPIQWQTARTDPKPNPSPAQLSPTRDWVNRRYRVSILSAFCKSSSSFFCILMKSFVSIRNAEFKLQVGSSRAVGGLLGASSAVKCIAWHVGLPPLLLPVLLPSVVYFFRFPCFQSCFLWQHFYCPF